MSTKLELARYFVNIGISVIPVHYRAKTPAVEWGEFGYRPGNPSRLPTEQEIARWFASELTNIGICTGWQGLTVLDFDDANEYGKWLAAGDDVVRRSAYRVQTSRGVHVYVRLPHAERARKVGKVDIKGIGGYVLSAGSIHPSGAEYRAMRERIVIPLISALSDVLPAVELLANTEQAGMRLPRATALPQDAWAVAMSPRAMTGAIERIKKQFRIEEFFSDKTKTGSHWYVARCPLHDDSHPSLWIDVDRQICGCFAGCTSKPLDVINLYARVHGVSNTDAIRAMAAL
jgi:hypothetical protein